MKCKTVDVEEIVLYNVDDIQRMFGLGRNRAYQLLTSRGFPSIKLNRKILVEKKKLEEWIAKNSGKTYLF